MNIVLWVLQVLVGLAFVAVGYSHGFRAEQMKVQPGGQWLSAVPEGLRSFIAAAEVAGGLGVVLPTATGLLPWLTPLAAAGLALVMFLAMIFHLQRREYPNIAFNFVLLLLAAFISYGRFAVVPL